MVKEKKIEKHAEQRKTFGLLENVEAEHSQHHNFIFETLKLM